jgi:hypothetical protein
MLKRIIDLIRARGTRQAGSIAAIVDLARQCRRPALVLSYILATATARGLYAPITFTQNKPINIKTIAAHIHQL